MCSVLYVVTLIGVMSYKLVMSPWTTDGGVRGMSFFSVEGNITALSHTVHIKHQVYSVYTVLCIDKQNNSSSFIVGHGALVTASPWGRLHLYNSVAVATVFAACIMFLHFSRFPLIPDSVSLLTIPGRGNYYLECFFFACTIIWYLKSDASHKLPVVGMLEQQHVLSKICE